MDKGLACLVGFLWLIYGSILVLDFADRYLCKPSWCHRYFPRPQLACLSHHLLWKPTRWFINRTSSHTRAHTDYAAMTGPLIRDIREVHYHLGERVDNIRREQDRADRSNYDNTIGDYDLDGENNSFMANNNLVLLNPENFGPAPLRNVRPSGHSTTFQWAHKAKNLSLCILWCISIVFCFILPRRRLLCSKNLLLFVLVFFAITNVNTNQVESTLPPGLESSPNAIKNGSANGTTVAASTALTTAFPSSTPASNSTTPTTITAAPSAASTPPGAETSAGVAGAGKVPQPTKFRPHVETADINMLGDFQLAPGHDNKPVMAHAHIHDSINETNETLTTDSSSADAASAPLPAPCAPKCTTIKAADLPTYSIRTPEEIQEFISAAEATSIAQAERLAKNKNAVPSTFTTTVTTTGTDADGKETTATITAVTVATFTEAGAPANASLAKKATTTGSTTFLTSTTSAKSTKSAAAPKSSKKAEEAKEKSSKLTPDKSADLVNFLVDKHNMGPDVDVQAVNIEYVYDKETYNSPPSFPNAFFPIDQDTPSLSNVDQQLVNDKHFQRIHAPGRKALRKQALIDRQKDLNDFGEPYGPGEYRKMPKQLLHDHNVLKEMETQMEDAQAWELEAEASRAAVARNQTLMISRVYRRLKIGPSHQDAEPLQNNTYVYLTFDDPGEADHLEPGYVEVCVSPTLDEMAMCIDKSTTSSSGSKSPTKGSNSKVKARPGVSQPVELPGPPKLSEHKPAQSPDEAPSQAPGASSPNDGLGGLLAELNKAMKQMQNNQMKIASAVEDLQHDQEHLDEKPKKPESKHQRRSLEGDIEARGYKDDPFFEMLEKERARLKQDQEKVKNKEPTNSSTSPTNVSSEDILTSGAPLNGTANSTVPASNETLPQVNPPLVYHYETGYEPNHVLLVPEENGHEVADDTPKPESVVMSTFAHIHLTGAGPVRIHLYKNNTGFGVSQLTNKGWTAEQRVYEFTEGLFVNHADGVYAISDLGRLIVYTPPPVEKNDGDDAFAGDDDDDKKKAEDALQKHRQIKKSAKPKIPRTSPLPKIPKRTVRLPVSGRGVRRDDRDPLGYFTGTYKGPMPGGTVPYGQPLKRYKNLPPDLPTVYPGAYDASGIGVSYLTTFSRLQNNDFATIDDLASISTDGKGHSNGAFILVILHRPRLDETKQVEDLLAERGIFFDVVKDWGHMDEGVGGGPLDVDSSPIVPDADAIRYSNGIKWLKMYDYINFGLGRPYKEKTKSEDKRQNDKKGHKKGKKKHGKKHRKGGKNHDKLDKRDEHDKDNEDDTEDDETPPERYPEWRLTTYAVIDDDIIVPDMARLIAKLRENGGLVATDEIAHALSPVASQPERYNQNMYLGFPSDPWSDWTFHNGSTLYNQYAWEYHTMGRAVSTKGLDSRFLNPNVSSLFPTTFGGGAVFMAANLAHRVADLPCLRTSLGDNNTINTLFKANRAALVRNEHPEASWDEQLFRCVHSEIPEAQLRLIPSFYSPTDVARYGSSWETGADDSDFARRLARMSQFDGGTHPIVMHNQRTWHAFDAAAASQIGDLCGADCYLQRFDFGDGWILANGHSLTHYEGLSVHPLPRHGEVDGSGMEDWLVGTKLRDRYHEYQDQRAYYQTLGVFLEDPARPRDPVAIEWTGHKRTYKLLETTVLEDGSVVQVYARHKRTGLRDLTAIGGRASFETSHARLAAPNSVRGGLDGSPDDEATEEVAPVRDQLIILINKAPGKDGPLLARHHNTGHSYHYHPGVSFSDVRAVLFVLACILEAVNYFSLTHELLVGALEDRPCLHILLYSPLSYAYNHTVAFVHRSGVIEAIRESPLVVKIWERLDDFGIFSIPARVWGQACNCFNVFLHELIEYSAGRWLWRLKRHCVSGSRWLWHYSKICWSVVKWCGLKCVIRFYNAVNTFDEMSLRQMVHALKARVFQPLISGPFIKLPVLLHLRAPATVEADEERALLNAGDAPWWMPNIDPIAEPVFPADVTAALEGPLPEIAVHDMLTDYEELERERQLNKESQHALHNHIHKMATETGRSTREIMNDIVGRGPSLLGAPGPSSSPLSSSSSSPRRSPRGRKVRFSSPVASSSGSSTPTVQRSESSRQRDVSADTSWEDAWREVDDILAGRPVTEEATQEVTDEVTEAVEETVEDTVKETAKETVNVAIDEAIDEATEEATEEAIEEATEAVTEEATGETTDEATEKAIEEAPEETPEGTAEAGADGGTGEVTGEVAEMPTGESIQQTPTETPDNSPKQTSTEASSIILEEVSALNSKEIPDKTLEKRPEERLEENLGEVENIAMDVTDDVPEDNFEEAAEEVAEDDDEDVAEEVTEEVAEEATKEETDETADKEKGVGVAEDVEDIEDVKDVEDAAGAEDAENAENAENAKENTDDAVEEPEPSSADIASPSSEAGPSSGATSVHDPEKLANARKTAKEYSNRMKKKNKKKKKKKNN